MADVTSGNQARSPWIGVPSSTGVSQRRSAGQMEALGLSPDEIARRRPQTGVDPGAQGYVSGQQAPTGRAMAALGAVAQQTGGQTQQQPTFSNPAPGVAGTIAQPGGQFRQQAGVTQSGPIGPHPNLYPGATPGPGGGTPRPLPGVPGASGDTTTVSSALTAPGTAPPTQAPGRGAMPAVASDTTTRTGAVTAGNTGTTQGQRPVPIGGNASPTVAGLNQVSPGLGDSLDPGSKLVDQYLRPTLADTGPAVASQQAAFGTTDALESERYNYRPGAAASQDRVALEKANEEQIRQRQLAALDALTGAANGTVPSAAELQMRREAGRNVAATLGQARALGGRSAGGAARAGTLASADILAKNTADTAALRAAEQDRNRQALVQALGGTRAQDVDVAGQDARLAQEANANNLRAQLDQNELAERHRQALLQAQLQALGIGAGSGNAIVQAGAANAAAQNKFQGGVLGAIGSAIGI